MSDMGIASVMQLCHIRYPQGSTIALPRHILHHQTPDRFIKARNCRPAIVVLLPKAEKLAGKNSRGAGVNRTRGPKQSAEVEKPDVDGENHKWCGPPPPPLERRIESGAGASVHALLSSLAFLLIAYGFYGVKSSAQEVTPWDGNPANGTVEVDGDVSSLTLRAGETKTYRIRLTKQPTEDNWWVRIFVNGVVRHGGELLDDQGDKIITWSPPIGWKFDRDNNDDKAPTRWRGISIKAHQDITTPIKIMHEVFSTAGECPIHDVGKITVSSPISNPNPNPNPNPNTNPNPHNNGDRNSGGNGDEKSGGNDDGNGNNDNRGRTRPE